MRRTFVAGNWKMNLNLPAIRDLTRAIVAGVQATTARQAVETAVCPPFPYLFPTAKALAGSSILLGAQDLYFEADGAFTGEVSAAMVAETGARFVILGHSERRHTIGHHEDDWMINQKIHAALAANLQPIFCIGETLAQRDADATNDVLTYQTTAGLLGVSHQQLTKIVIAYEPVWAIGTGRTATPQQAQDAHAHIRGVIRKLAAGAAVDMRILYGGSVKPDNAREIFAMPDVDGGLIGGASLKADAFLGIIDGALAAKPGKPV
jgi:triosephosphate isomerase